MHTYEENIKYLYISTKIEAFIKIDSLRISVK